jgi:mono/diheme cytochrome c family protein
VVEASGDAARGKKIFVVRCVACHKADGSGGVKLTGNATPDWRDAKRMDDPRHGDDSLRACITNGKIQSGMVAWGKTGQLRPAQIEDLIVYIRAFSKKRPPGNADAATFFAQPRRPFFRSAEGGLGPSQTRNSASPNS